MVSFIARFLVAVAGAFVVRVLRIERPDTTRRKQFLPHHFEDLPPGLFFERRIGQRGSNNLVGADRKIFEIAIDIVGQV